MCRTLIIFYILFRPGHLLSTGRLFFLMQSSGQDAYLGTPFIRYRRVHALVPVQRPSLFASMAVIATTATASY